MRAELKSLIGQPAQIRIEVTDGTVRYLDGCASAFTLAGSDDRSLCGNAARRERVAIASAPSI
ncbi:phage late control D family protein [Pseudomonas sp. GD03842]|uniref:hypothetical protein n=1 Tax=Pseudomonas sp. GD03842 TaxID=2975385 RepID=UPI002447A6B4|nr:hypothetical protein [Pseudomonas sp. GD03842]MDH0749847.1 phage late control D family protein [Pseudomonas sp. GD03842]